MSGRVSLSRRDAEAVARAWDYLPDHLYVVRAELGAAFERLRAALRPSPKRIAAKKRTKASKAETRAAHNAETSAIYLEVEKRADGKCEACGKSFHPGDPPHMDHWRGRGKARQSIQNCRLIHGLSCHREKHAGRPSRDFWFRVFLEHCDNRGYWGEARRARADLAWVEAKGVGR